MEHKDYTGQILDKRYEVLSLLGFGGMGAVYLGRHVVLDKTVAIKFLHADYVGDKDVVRRFYREAQAAAAIRHKNIIDVMDVGVSSKGEPYFVMEYLEGESLSEMLTRTGPLSLSAACGILAPVLSALRAAHGRGIVHRDLKPDNIFIAIDSEGAPTVKLIDFGISKFTASRNTGMTRTGALIGTPAYMSPEQIVAAKSVDHRADIYAVGVVMYEMLTGRQPFEGDNYETMIFNVMSGRIVPPKKAYRDFPREMEPLLMRTLSRNPGARPQTADALLKELKALTEYRRHRKQLSRCVSNITEKSYPKGTLGPKAPESSSPVAAEVFSELRPRRKRTTPTDWLDGYKYREKRRTRICVSGTAIFIGIVVTTAIAIRFHDTARSTKTPQLVHPAVDIAEDSKKEKKRAMDRFLSPKPSPGISDIKQDVVRLDITGLPPNAEIELDGVRYDSPSLSVKRSDKLSTLKVRAAGYGEWVRQISPNKNDNIVVRLEPLAKSPKKIRRPHRSARRSKKQDLPLNTENNEPVRKSGSDEFKTVW